MSAPGPIRLEELRDEAMSLRWLNSLRDAVRDLERRPRVLVWEVGPTLAVNGTVALDAPPWTVGAVALVSVVGLDGGGLPFGIASSSRLTDGRILITYSLLFVGTATKFQLKFLLVEAVNG